MRVPHRNKESSTARNGTASSTLNERMEELGFEVVIAAGILMFAHSGSKERIGQSRAKCLVGP